jgi:dihydroxy-acid dehydratase
MSQDRGYRRNLTNYGDRKFALYLRRSFAQATGLSRELMDKPIVGIARTDSGFNNCHRGVPELVEAVKRGVLAAGGLPLDFPTVSLGEVFLSPTSLMFRNLMSMDTEEMIRAQPMDAVVLVGGCDKTVPAQLMGAASADLPAIQLVTGPMLAMHAMVPAPTAGASGPRIAPAKWTTRASTPSRRISPRPRAPVP